MAVSETTLLLPSHRSLNDDVPMADYRNRQGGGGGSRRGILKRYNIVLVIAVFLGCVGIFSVIRQTIVSSSSSNALLETRTTTHSKQQLPFINDIEMLQWDDWKDDIDRAQTWVGGMTHTVQEQVQTDTNQLSSWWDTTAPNREQFVQSVSNNANKFGHLVKSWWDTTTTNTERTISDADIPDKVSIIEHNFQSWWKKANTAERQWWNSTVQQLQVDEKQTGKWLQETGSTLHKKGNVIGETIKEKGGVWLNATKDELGKDTGKLEDLEKKWATSTQQALQTDEQAIGDVTSKLMNETKRTVADDAGKISEVSKEWINVANDNIKADTAIALQKGSNLLNSTGEVWKEDVAKASDKTKDWLNVAKSSLKDKADIALQKGSSLLNETEDALSGGETTVSNKVSDWFTAVKSTVKDDAAMTLEKGSGLLNITEESINGDVAHVSEAAKGWFNNAETSVKDEGKVLWNETQNDAHHIMDATDQKFALWWDITKGVVEKDVNEVSNVEQGWWNATEDWFHQHIKLPHIANREVTMTTAAEEKTLLYLNTSFAYSLLMNGYHWYDYSNDFFLYQQGWDVQINQGYCAIASAAAVINSFHSYDELTAASPNYDPYKYATQSNLINDCVSDSVIHHNATFDGVMTAPGGLTLNQLQKLLECHNLEATLYYVDPTNVTVDEVRQNIEEALMNPNKRVIVNFDRHAMGQDGGGHFSPIGSYTKKEDSFLLMDVAKYKYPPVWIPTQLLYGALASEDCCGDWLYPSAQDKLHHAVHHHPKSAEAYQSIMRTLHCQKVHRGYIIVELPS